jgi:hypothetical protein
MVAIVTRAGKGSPLTNAEVDANFTNLNNGKVETNFSAVVAALGYTPYNATNPSNFLDQAGVRASFSATGALTYNSTTGVFGVNVPVTSVFGRTGAVVLQSADVTGALGYTPPQPGGTGASGTWGISISGNAATVTNGVYTTGDQTIGGVKTFSSDIRVGGTSGRFINCDSGATNAIRFTNQANSAYVATFANNGDFTAAGNVTAFSDERLKKDWAAVPSDFLQKLAYVKSGTYTRIDSGERQAGVSAQDIQAILPEVVQGGEYLSLAYGNAALVAVVELAREVLTIREKLARIAQEE